MIKTKEDLHHTFIDGSCEELKNKLLEKAKEFVLEVNPSAHKNVAIGINLAQVGKPSYFQVDHNGTHLEYYRDLLKYRELTLEDFEEVQFTIPWDDAPEGYDYWIITTGAHLSEGSFHKKHGLAYEDQSGFYWEIGYEGYHYQVYTKPDNTLPKEKQDTVESLKAAIEGSEVKNYKYTPVEVESIFDLREMFEKGELYFRWLGNPEKGSGGVGYDQITNENMLICRYEEGRLLLREEVKWQNEVESSCFWFEYSESHDSVHLNTKNSIPSEDFLETCRVALRANGELK